MCARSRRVTLLLVGGGAAQQPEVVLEVHEDQEEVDHHGAEGEEDAVHAGGWRRCGAPAALTATPATER